MKKMKSPYLDKEFIIRSNNMGKAKVVAEGMKKIGNKLVKKRMTAAQRKEMSKDFIKSGQPKGLTDKQFNAKIKKDMSKQKRIDSVKEKNMAASKDTKPNKKDDYFNSAEYKKFEAKMLKKIDKGLKDTKPKKKADGGMMKYKDGGSVSPKRSSKKGVGAAVRGFGKALR